MVTEWQYTNEFFTQGVDHYNSGGDIKDCPYDYLSVDQTDSRLIQIEIYKTQEWYAGFRHAYQQKLEQNK